MKNDKWKMENKNCELFISIFHLSFVIF